jgi:hypothetical protein
MDGVIAGVLEPDPERLAVPVWEPVCDPVPSDVPDAVGTLVTVADTLFVGLKVLEAVVEAVPV